MHGLTATGACLWAACAAGLLSFTVSVFLQFAARIAMLLPGLPYVFHYMYIEVCTVVWWESVDVCAPGVSRPLSVVVLPAFCSTLLILKLQSARACQSLAFHRNASVIFYAVVVEVCLYLLPQDRDGPQAACEQLPQLQSGHAAKASPSTSCHQCLHCDGVSHVLSASCFVHESTETRGDLA